MIVVVVIWVMSLMMVLNLPGKRYCMNGVSLKFVPADHPIPPGLFQSKLKIEDWNEVSRELERWGGFFVNNNFLIRKIPSLLFQSSFSARRIKQTCFHPVLGERKNA